MLLVNQCMSTLNAQLLNGSGHIYIYIEAVVTEAVPIYMTLYITFHIHQ